MPRKVRLVLSSMWSDLVKRWLFLKTQVFPSLVCWALWHINPCRPLNAKPRLYTLNLKFPNKYLVDNISAHLPAHNQMSLFFST